MSSVFSMVTQVLADSKEKIAAEMPTKQKVASTRTPESGGTKTSSDNQSPEKVAMALDYLADNIHLVKQASMEDEPKGPHQSQMAGASFQSPKSPGMTGDQAGAGGNQIASGGNSREGDGVLEAGRTGQATSEKINPMSVSPGQSAFPGDAARNALETTQEESDRPGGSDTAPMKIARARAVKLAQLVSAGKLSEKVAAAMIAKDRVKVASVMRKSAAAHLAKKASAAGVPPSMARALINKLAADAENPAQISAGSTPALQTAPDAFSPVQSQGTAAGDGTPATKGSDQGREALQSVMAVINSTKGQLKGKRTRSEMGSYLSEPAFSSSHDNVLQQSLENASSAGVKIAAAKEMLQKWASSSPRNAERLNLAIMKVAEGEGPMPEEEGAEPEAAMPGDAQPESVPAPGAGEGAMGGEPVSDAALAAAAQGVTPEDLAMAEAMLEEQGVGAVDAAPPPEEVAPPPEEPTPAAEEPVPPAA